MLGMIADVGYFKSRATGKCVLNTEVPFQKLRYGQTPDARGLAGREGL